MARPSLIDRVIGYRQDDQGNTHAITVADRIVNAMRAGSYFEPACNAAGISAETGWSWRRIAGRVRIRARGEPVETIRPRPTAHEVRCIEFSDAVAEAESAWEVGALATLELLARGGIPLETVTEKTDAQGNVIERTTKTSKTLPDANVIQWRLTRRFPHRYGNRIEVTDGPDAGDPTPEERAAALADTLAAFLDGAEPKKRKPRAKKAAQVIEARSTPRALPPAEGGDDDGSEIGHEAGSA